MAQTTAMDFVSVDELPARARIGVLLNRGLFGSLAALLCLTAIPYGTSQPWWKALFICLILAATIVAVIEGILSRSSWIGEMKVLLPVAAMASLAFLQTVPLPGNNHDSALTISIWKAISADPYQTRFVALQLLALFLVLALLYRYGKSEPRIRILIHVILGVAVVSAIFGILRQSVQAQPGFVLPILRPGAGYAQFTNKNHFGFMMEMAFGLGVGLIIGGGINRKHSVVYVAMLLPIWIGLVMSTSRGAVLAMISQLAVAGLLITPIKRKSIDKDSPFLQAMRPLVLRFSFLLVLVFAALFGAIWVGGDRLISSFESVSRELRPDTAITHAGVTRNEIWRATLRMFTANPILGVGLGGYWIGITAHHEASGTMTPQEAHNDYLELLASGGVAGFAIGVWFVIAVIQSARKALNSTNTESRFRRATRFGAVLGISGVAFHSLFDFGLHMMANALMLAVLLMIVTAPGKESNTESH